MSPDPTDTPSPPAVEGTPIAGFWRRVGAFAIDGVLLGVPAAVVGFAFFPWAVGLGQMGRLIGFALALAYFGVLNSRLGGGQTLGKRLLGIRVTDRAGEALSLPRLVLRFLVLAIPYFLNGLWIDVDAASAGPIDYVLGVALGFLVFGGGGAIVYLIVFNRRTRQSLHDLAVGSFVVRDPPAAVPIGLTTPRLHLIVVGCWLTLALIGPSAGIWYVARNAQLAGWFQPLIGLQAAIQAKHGIRRVKVVIGQSTTATLRSGPSKITFLRVEAQLGAEHGDLDKALSAIARTVLDRHPDLLGHQVLIVVVSRGFDLGLVRWREVHREALDAAAWRKKLAPLRARLGPRIRTAGKRFRPSRPWPPSTESQGQRDIRVVRASGETPPRGPNARGG